MTSQSGRRAPSSRAGRATDKSRSPKAGDDEDRVDKTQQRGAIQHSEEDRQAVRGTGGPEYKWIPPKVSPYTEFSRDRAEKLATLRRGRWDEFTWAAIGGFAASVPGTAHTVSNVIPKQPFSLSLSESVDLAITLVFVVLLGVALFGRNRGQTSMEYLEEHFGTDTKSKRTD